MKADQFIQSWNDAESVAGANARYRELYGKLKDLENQLLQYAKDTNQLEYLRQYLWHSHFDIVQGIGILQWK